MAQNTFNPINILDTSEADGIGSGGSLTIGGGASVGKNFYIGGGLSVSGTSTSFSDNILLVNKDPNISVDTGILFQRYTDDIINNQNYCGMIYSEQQDEFQFAYMTSDIHKAYSSNSYFAKIKTNGVNSISSSNTLGSIITTGGNVGIGKIPGYTIDINGDINFTGNFYKNGNIYSGSEIWSTNGTKLYYTSGNIGLGTSNPNHQLDVVGGIKSSLGVTTSSINCTDITSGTVQITTVNATNIYTSSDFRANLSRFTTVNNGESQLKFFGKFQNGNALDTTDRNVAQILCGLSGDWGSSYIKFQTGAEGIGSNKDDYVNGYGTERMRITDSGIGIGTSSPTTTLDVNGTLKVTTSISTSSLQSSSLNLGVGMTAGGLYATNGILTNISVGSLVVSGDSNTIGNIFMTGGNVGIGVSLPLYPLHVSGDIYTTGDVTVFSDRRLKTDIETISNSLNLVSKLRGVSYRRIDNNKTSIGLIAQETLEVLPEAVDTKGEYLGINYGNIVGLLVEAIKEIKKEQDELKSIVSKLGGLSN